MVQLIGFITRWHCGQREGGNQSHERSEPHRESQGTQRSIQWCEQSWGLFDAQLLLHLSRSFHRQRPSEHGRQHNDIRVRLQRPTNCHHSIKYGPEHAFEPSKQHLDYRRGMRHELMIAAQPVGHRTRTSIIITRPGNQNESKFDTSCTDHGITCSFDRAIIIPFIAQE
jgi:hypothetical protein